MIKGHRVGRPSFSRVFFSVNSFSTEVDRVRVRAIKKEDIQYTDEEHGEEIVHRVNRNLSGRQETAPLSFIHPRGKLPLDHALCLAMSCGFQPATHLEAAVALKTATSEQIGELFDQVDEMTRSRGLSPLSVPALSVACLGSCVGGQTGELIPVYGVDRFSGLSEPFQLRKLDFKAPLWPAMMIPFIERI